MDLFLFAAESTPRASLSLAERLRPQAFQDLLGFRLQQIPWLLDQIQNSSAEAPSIERLRSLIVTGPPGCGKTSFIRLLKKYFVGPCRELLASDFSVKDFRILQDEARRTYQLEGHQTLLFLDEVHRLGRVHQDSLLSILERPELVLLGATTENPFAVLSRALLSRCQVIQFQALGRTHFNELYKRARSAGVVPELAVPILSKLIQRSHGDARVFLNELELTAQILTSRSSVASEAGELAPSPSEAPELLSAVEQSGHWASPDILTVEELEALLGEQKLDFDPNARDHSVAISGFIKAMRSHQVDKALAWLAVMIKGQVDIEFIARRMMIFASEDVGNADPRALQVAVSAAQAIERIGLPEARIILAQAVSYLATAPKSRASYDGIGRAEEWALVHSRSELFDALDPKSSSPLPHFYEPREIGYEKNIAEFLKRSRSQSLPE